MLDLGRQPVQDASIEVKPFRRVGVSTSEIPGEKALGRASRDHSEAVAILEKGLLGFLCTKRRQPAVRDSRRRSHIEFKPASSVGNDTASLSGPQPAEGNLRVSQTE